MTIFDAAVLGLTNRGVTQTSARELVRLYRAKRIVNESIWEKDASEVAIDPLLICYNSISAITLGEIVKHYRTQTPDARIDIKSL